MDIPPWTVDNLSNIKMLSFVGIIVLFAAPLNGQGFGSNSLHGLRCCQHDIWTGTYWMTTVALDVNNTATTYEQIAMTIDYDYSMLMQKINMTMYDRLKNSTSYRVEYMDYANKKLYSVIEDGTCTVDYNTEEMFPPCIKGDWTYVGRTVIGSGEDTVHGDSWQGMHNNRQFTYMVTEHDCTPVTVSVFHETGSKERYITNGMFSGVQQGTLSYPDTFHRPDACKSASLPVGK